MLTEQNVRLLMPTMRLAAAAMLSTSLQFKLPSTPPPQPMIPLSCSQSWWNLVSLG
ncbi:hypothetical protein BDV93DRAFT_235942 [Ceratobasidium sp. AG-I]|nr:hypothetical protein BDV93DRAFT_235942 [Ceratobasidium sp. AG-I]